MSAVEPIDPEPRKLTTGDKVYLSFAFLLTLIRVAGLLGASFSFLMFGISFAFEDSPAYSHLANAGWLLAVYAVTTAVLHYSSKRNESM